MLTLDDGMMMMVRLDEFAEQMLFVEGGEWSDPQNMQLWNSYRKDPVRFFIHASDAHREALWAIIEKRLTKGESND